MFDRYAATTAPSWGRRALALAAIAVHGTAALVLVVYSICRIEEIPPPALAITFLSAPRPPAPPPAGSPKPKASHPAPKRSVIKASTTPAVIEPAVREEPTSSAEPSTAASGASGAAGAADGQPGGVTEGQPGGDAASHGNAPRSAPMFVLMASAIEAPDPHLTDAFKNSHAGQSVGGAYRICVGTDGHVTDVSVIASVPSMDELITSHLRSAWRFKPQPLPVCFTKPFRFNIK